MKKIYSEQGYSLIETAIVMMLLLLFSLGIFLLASTTSTTYERLVDEKTDTEDVRIATSYLVTKFRQNDRTNAITVDYRTIEGSDAVVIQEELLGDTYQTWIYLADGSLRELTILEGETIEFDRSFEIVKLDSFKISVNEKTVKMSLVKGDSDASDVVVTLKSNIGMVK